MSCYDKVDFYSIVSVTAVSSLQVPLFLLRANKVSFLFCYIFLAIR